MTSRPLFAFMLIYSSASYAVEYPFAYEGFAYHPGGWVGEGLTEAQSAEIRDCQSFASGESGKVMSKREMMAVIYGLRMKRADPYGSELTRCLVGKDWVVLKNEAGNHVPVDLSLAVESFMEVRKR